MRSYRSCWRVAAGALALPGLVVAALAVPVVALVVIAAVAGLVAGLVARVGRRRREPGATRARAGAATAFAAGAVAALAAAGLTVLLGPSGLALWLLVLVISPQAASWCGSRLGPRLGLRPVADPPAPPDPPGGARTLPSPDSHRHGDAADAADAADAIELQRLRSLTDAELSLVWRKSFTAVHQVRHGAELEQVGRERGRYLDEIERRNPMGFGRWMASGARASSDPSRYLSIYKPSGTQDR